MADWTTISSLATGGGTLVLAIATFSSVRSSNRSARLAEKALLANQRPILAPSRDDDPLERVRFGDDVVLDVSGHGGAISAQNDNVYMAMALRNGGSGVAVLRAWRAEVADVTGDDAPDLDEFRPQSRHLYIPAGDTGFWQGAVRDDTDPLYKSLRDAAEHRRRVLIDVLYGDQDGGQRAIVRFSVSEWPNVPGERADVVRHWNVDRDDPR
jgi:hypothetical protein